MLVGELGVVAPVVPSFAQEDVIAAHSRNPSNQPACDNDPRSGAAAAGRDEGHRTGMMDIVVAEITIRVDASVDEAALRRVLSALRRR